MSHNQYVIPILHNLTKCLRLNARFNTGISVHLLRFAAVVVNFITVFNDRLISASCKCKVY